MGCGGTMGPVWERDGGKECWATLCLSQHCSCSSMETPLDTKHLHEWHALPGRVPFSPHLFHLSDACCFGIAKDPTGDGSTTARWVPRTKVHSQAYVEGGGGLASPLHKNWTPTRDARGHIPRTRVGYGLGQSGGPAPRAHTPGTNTHIARPRVSGSLPSRAQQLSGASGPRSQKLFAPETGSGLVGRGKHRDSGLAWQRQGWFLLNDPSESEHSISQMGRRHVPSSYVTLQRRKGASS